jgi:hypothetical protein
VPGQGQWYIPKNEWTGDLITISQSVDVVGTQLWIHLYTFGLKVMYNLKQQRNSWSLPTIWRELLKFWGITPNNSLTLKLLESK